MEAALAEMALDDLNKDMDDDNDFVDDKGTRAIRTFVIEFRFLTHSERA